MELTMHGTREATVEFNRGRSSHWITITATDERGQELEVTLFHDGRLTLRDVTEQEECANG